MGLDFIGPEAAMDEVECFVGQATTLVTRDAERAKFRIHPAHSDAQLQTTVGQLLNGCQRLGGGQRRPVRKIQYAGSQSDARAARGEVGECRERIEIAAARADGVIGRDGDVILNPDVVEPGALGSLDTADE